MANGVPKAKLYNIPLRNIEVKKALKTTQLRNVENLVLDHVKVNGKVITRAEE